MWRTRAHALAQGVSLRAAALRSALARRAAASATAAAAATDATAAARAGVDAGDTFRCRFAPSPTGYLHLGGLRSALFNFLAAKSFAQRTGRRAAFVLRIEDTDQKRLVPGSVEHILRALRWAGLPPDEAPDIGGPYGPYVQSQRLPLYRAHALQLVDGGHAYPCFCSPARLAALKATHVQYDAHCARVYPTVAQRKAQIAAAEHSKTPYVIRLQMPRTGVSVVEDVVKGRVVYENARVDDQVLVKGDGWPTYHLASVVDDHHMRITHVIRGEEWLASTPKHMRLYAAFGWTPPVWAHVPLLLTTARQKLSKRNSDTNVQKYVDAGYLPAAVLNFVALLGWNSRATAADAAANSTATAAAAAAAPASADARKGGATAVAAAAAAADAPAALAAEEFFPSLQPLIERFALSKLSPAPSVVDEERLRGINALHFKHAVTSAAAAAAAATASATASNVQPPHPIVAQFMSAARAAYPDAGLDATAAVTAAAAAAAGGWFDAPAALRLLHVLCDRACTVSEAVSAARVFLCGPDLLSAPDACERFAKAWRADADATVAHVIAALQRPADALTRPLHDANASVSARLDSATALLTRVMAERGVNPKKPAALYYPLRWALTGHHTGAPVAELLMVLGAARTAQLLQRAREAAAAQPRANK